MSAMSLQTTSQHFRVKFRITSRPIATEGNKWTTEWKKGAQNDNPISIFNLHHMMQSHKLFWNCCVQSNIFSSKGKKTTHKKKTEKNINVEMEGKKENKRIRGRNIRRCVLLHTSNWVATSTAETWNTSDLERSRLWREMANNGNAWPFDSHTVPHIRPQ